VKKGFTTEAQRHREEGIAREARTMRRRAAPTSSLFSVPLCLCGSIPFAEGPPMRVDLPAAFSGLFTPARYKAFYGGRGSAKSHSFAAAALLLGGRAPLRILCGRVGQNCDHGFGEAAAGRQDRGAGLGLLLPRAAERDSAAPIGLTLHLRRAGRQDGRPDQVRCRASTNAGSRRRRHLGGSLEILIPTIPQARLPSCWFSWNPRHPTDPIDSSLPGPAIPKGR